MISDDSLRALYGRDAGAREHAPQTHDEFRIACHELRSRGFSDHSIASATGLSVEYVRRLLGEVQA